jgi:insertion element IS1 protein InsB
VLAPDANDPEATILELDELWSFVLKKTNKAWIWIALCRKTRQVVAYAIGDRSEKTCRILWESIPEAYRAGHCFTDFWGAYQAVIPEEQHTAVGKETGETAHVERWNHTLRQRLAMNHYPITPSAMLSVSLYSLTASSQPCAVSLAPLVGNGAFCAC